MFSTNACSCWTGVTVELTKVELVINASIATTSNEKNLDNNEFDLVVPLAASVDLQVDIDDNGILATNDSLVPYDIFVWNNGQRSSEGTLVEVNIPDLMFYDENENPDFDWNCEDTVPQSLCRLNLGVIEGNGAEPVYVQFIPHAEKQLSSNSSTVTITATVSETCQSSTDSDVEETPLDICNPDFCGECNGNNTKCCYNERGVPNYFWDWLLFPVAVDELIIKLEDLKNTLIEINDNLPDYENIPSESGLDFSALLDANYAWLASEEGCLVPLNDNLEVMWNLLETAVTKQQAEAEECDAIEP